MPKRIVLATIVFVVLAASAFLVIRVGTDATTPITLAGLRFFTAAVGFAILAIVRPGLIDHRFEKRDLPLFLFTGATGFVAYSLFLMKGQETASASTASLIVATVPIWATIFAVTLGRERLPAIAWLGVALAFAGTLIITVDPESLGRFASGEAFILAAALANGSYFVAVRRLVVRYGAISAVAGTVWTGAVLFVPLAFLMEPPSTWTTVAISSGLFLGLGATLAGSSLIAYLIGRMGAARATVTLYLVPPIVVAMEWLLFGTAPGPDLLVGGTLTLTGLFLARPRYKRETTMTYTNLPRKGPVPPIHVRSATVDDIPALLKLTNELAQFQDLGDRYAATEAGIRAGLFGRHRSAEAIVAEKDQVIVGYAIIAQSFSSTRGARKLIVEDIFVAPHERGCGAGFAMFRVIAQKAKKIGACQAEWAVQQDNRAALDFYDKLGAVPSKKWVTCEMDGRAIEGLACETPDRESARRPVHPIDRRGVAECC